MDLEAINYSRCNQPSDYYICIERAEIYGQESHEMELVDPSRDKEAKYPFPVSYF